MDPQAQIYLASNSPRRMELLTQIGIRFAHIDASVDEAPHPGEAPEVYVLRLALTKARAGLERVSVDDARPVLGADTAVVIDGELLGKPADRAHGLTMLERLSGREHQVLSAVALVDRAGHEASRLSVSHVRFRATSEAERRGYWQSGEPVDKAGGYAIQGLGAVFVEELAGSYSGVMGLPIFETAQLLNELKIAVVAETFHE